MERNRIVDIMKGLGICLVIMGHVLTYGSVLSKFILSFHMPLFFFLSGFLSRNNTRLQTKHHWDYFLHFFSLYIIFTTLGLTRLIFNSSIFRDTIPIGLYRTLVHCHSYINGPTWFLVTLPLSVLLIVFLHRITNRWGGYGMVLVLLLFIPLSFCIQQLPTDVRRLTVPLNATNLPLTSFYVGCGWLYAEKGSLTSKKFRIWEHAIGLLCLAVPLVFASFSWIGMMSCSSARAGKILNIPTALFGICGIYWLSVILSNLKIGDILGIIGKRSLAFFALDFISSTILTAIMAIMLPGMKGYLPTSSIPLKVSLVLWCGQMCLLGLASGPVIKAVTFFQGRVFSRTKGQ